jgi:Ca-activated chloride channel family protein
MNRHLTIPLAWIAGAGSFLILISPPIRGSLQQADGDSYTFRSDVRLVLLDVNVKDRDGKPVPGLAQENFRVFENGRPQRITVFDHADLPVTVGILVDESRSMSSKRADVLTAAQTFIEESNPRDQVFVLNFNDRVTRGLPPGVLFSDKLSELRAALYRGFPEGKTALRDAVIAGLRQLELGQRDKKTLVVISDGGDTTSEHTRAQMLNAVSRSIATVYAIGLFDADEPDQDPGILRQLARITGGEAFFPADSSVMVPLCRKIAKQIRTRYTVGYIPQTLTGGNSPRHIQVSVSSPGHSKFTVQARTSYRFDPAESAKRP